MTIFGLATIVTALSLSHICTTAANEAQPAEEKLIRVQFKNEFPELTIELFWENHDVPDDHPERRKLEGAIPPRGGSIIVDTFLGHGTNLFLLTKEVYTLFCT